MKQVKILKRPSPPPTPTTRISTEVTSLLTTALTRERVRLETTFRTRQEALLRAISTVLNDTLASAVQTAASRETDMLLASFAKLAAVAPSPPGAPDDGETRAAFAAAFERAALPSFEGALRGMLAAISDTVEMTVSSRVARPAEDVALALEGAADGLREAGSAARALARPTGEEADLAAVQDALGKGDAGRALQLCVGKSVRVRSVAVSGVLDSGVKPEAAFSEGVPRKGRLVRFVALLAMELGDRTEARLGWLYEVVMLMDEAEDGPEGEGDVLRGLLEGSIERLGEFQKGGGLPAKESKHVKLLIRVLTAHLHSV